MTVFLLRFSCFAIICIGVATSGYLLVRHFHLSDSTEPDADFCSAVFGYNCDETLESDFAVQLGLPLAGWGLVYYGSLASLLVLAWSVGEAFISEATLAAWLLSLAGAAGSIVLLCIMLSGEAPVCPLCVIVHAANLALIPLLKLLTDRSITEGIAAVSAAVAYVFGAKPADSQLARWRVVGFLSAGLVAAVIYQWVYVEVVLNTRAEEAPFDAFETILTFESGQQQDIAIGESDPRIGPDDACVRLVIFSDFRCPGCAQVAKSIPLLAHRFGEHLQIVFKHYPLDSQCNPIMKGDLHPKACVAAAAAEAARCQGKFWQFHDTLFAHEGGKQTLDEIAAHLALDAEQFNTDRRSESSAAKVIQDIEQGISLGVDGTPTVFLNGRRVIDARLEALEALISHEMEHHGHELHNHKH